MYHDVYLWMGDLRTSMSIATSAAVLTVREHFLPKGPPPVPTMFAMAGVALAPPATEPLPLPPAPD